VTTGLPPDGTVEVVFEQAGARRRVEAVPLAHLSVELGHLYMEDYRAGPARLQQLFERVAPWARTASGQPPGQQPGQQPGQPSDQPARARHAPGRRREGRVSTCFLIDDYFSTLSSPHEIVPALLAAAHDSGLAIDYLARE
jgi:hypothetical protein